MKKEIGLLLVICLTAQMLAAQTIKSGTIKYSIERQAQIQFSGKQLTQKMQTVDQLDFSDGYYRLICSLMPAEEAVSGINVSTGAAIMTAFYMPKERAVFQHMQSNGKHYGLVQNKTILTSIQPTGKMDSIMGFRVEEFTCLYNGETAQGWYCTSLPSMISPFGNLGLPGALLRFNSPAAVVQLLSIELNQVHEVKDLQLPADTKIVSKEEFMKESRQ